MGSELIEKWAWAWGLDLVKMGSDLVENQRLEIKQMRFELVENQRFEIKQMRFDLVKNQRFDLAKCVGVCVHLTSMCVIGKVQADMNENLHFTSSTSGNIQKVTRVNRCND